MKTQRPKKTTEWGSVWDAPDPAKMHERMGNLWVAWIWWASTLKDAAVVLGQCATHTKLPGGEMEMPSLLAVRAMLLGYALECTFKALWLRNGNSLVKGGKYVGLPHTHDHNLVQLAQATGFVATTNELDVLQRLSKFARFAGRYPVAKTTAEMKPDDLTRTDVGFFSKKDFRTAESLFKKAVSAVSRKRYRPFPHQRTILIRL
jgi:hypothetical protein